jgi:hypothetical protein
LQASAWPFTIAAEPNHVHKRECGGSIMNDAERFDFELAGQLKVLEAVLGMTVAMLAPGPRDIVMGMITRLAEGAAPLDQPEAILVAETASAETALRLARIVRSAVEARANAGQGNKPSPIR